MNTILRSNEFTCPSCVARIEGALHRVPGVRDAKVHFATGRIEVEHDPAAVTPADLASEVAAAGFAATLSPW